jgi:hypothetical protein
MNVEIGTEAAQFPEKEYINGFFDAVHILVWEILRFLLGNAKMSISMKDTAETRRKCVRQHPGEHWVHATGPHQQDKQRGWPEL